MKTTQEPSSEPSQRRRGNPAKLVPGVKESQERGPDGRLKAKGPTLTTDSTDMLAAMRHVVCQPSTADTTFQQRNIRRWMEDSPGAFHSRLTALEDAERPPSKSTASPAEKEWIGKGECPTCGTWVRGEEIEPGLKLLLEGIAADKKKLAAEDADLAARFDAAQLGRNRQEELKAALWREWQQRERFAELDGKRQGGDPIEPVTRIMFEEFSIQQFAADAALSIRPEPGKIISSLKRAIEGTEEREKTIRRLAEGLERLGPQTKAFSWDRQK